MSSNGPDESRSRYPVPETMALVDNASSMTQSQPWFLRLRDRLAHLPRPRLALGLILLAALVLRLNVAIVQPYLWDEDRNAIPLALSLSLSPGSVHLPIRGQHHPALPSYIIRASSELFGESRLGFRLLHVVLGTVAVALVYQLTALRYGTAAGLWAAALLGFNEYHVGVSSFATAKGPHLFVLLLAIVAFNRFLIEQKARYLYAGTAAVGVAFYAKEHSVLVLAVMGIVLLHSTYRQWLRSPHLYGAFALPAILVLPDLYWNLAASPSPPQAGYVDHFSRIGGLGISPYPFLFFARGAIRAVYSRFTGDTLLDQVAETPSMNTLLGGLLFALVVFRTLRHWRMDPGLRFQSMLFWFVFGFFALIQPGRPTPNLDLDPVAWYWTDVVLYPAVIISAVQLTQAGGGRTTRILYLLAALGMALAIARTAVWWPFVDENLLRDAT